MRKLKSWKLSLVTVMILASTSSALCSQIEEVKLCNEEYQCGTSASPFTVGQQYFYSFDLGSTVDMHKLFSEYQLGDAIQRGIMKNGSLMITPLSTCEFLVALSSTEQESSSTLLKVAIEDGTIRRVCSSSDDPTDSDTNILRALVSLLQGNLETSSDLTSYPEKLAHDIIIETDSEGTCLAKYVHCSNNQKKFIKYKLMDFCSIWPTTVDILQDINYKVDKLQKLANHHQPLSNKLCELEDTRFEHVAGLTICVIEKGDDGLITSSRCTESHHHWGRNWVLVKLEKVGKNGTPPKGLTFYMTGLKQQSTSTAEPLFQLYYDDVPPEQYISELRNALLILSNSTERKGLSMTGIQKLIDRVRYLLISNSSRTTLENCFDDLVESASHKQTIILLLTMAADEAHNESVRDFLKLALSHEFVKSQIPISDREAILHKTFRSIASLGAISKNSLEFSKFILDLVNGKESNYSASIRLAALMAFSKELHQFCTRMQLITGENYCRNNDLIQDWIGSEILNNVENAEQFAEKIPFLEAFSNFQRYSKTSCKDLMNLNKTEHDNLWTILNCYRNDACNKEGKTIFTTIVEDRDILVNLRIAAFLSMMKCSNEEDMTLVERVMKAGEAKNEELSAFIKIYFRNRLSNGILKAKPTFMEDRALLNNNAEIPPNSNKFAQASNTLLYRFSPSRDLDYLLETNILYFDQSAMIPQLISAQLHYSIAGVLQQTSYVAKWENVLQMEVYVDDARSSQQPLNFHLTIVVRLMELTILTKEVSLSQQGLLQIAQLFQRKLRNNFLDDHFGSVIKQKLLAVMKDTANLDIFKMAGLMNGNNIHPTVSGIQQKIVWRWNGIGRLSLVKEDCSELIQTNKESRCKLELRPDVNLEALTYTATGSSNYETGFFVKSNQTFTLPMDLLFARSEGEVSMEDVVKLTIPSSISHVFGGNDHILHAVDVEQGRVTSAQILSYMRMGAGGFSEDSRKTMEIEMRAAKKNFTIQILHPHYEAVLEGESSLSNLHGRYSCLQNGTVHTTSSFQVEMKNDDDHKRLQAKVKGENEYLLEAYFQKVRQLENSTDPQTSFCSGGRGLLCWRPFCSFCGTEYFAGATVSTPGFKNVKLFEGALTQIFPDKELGILLRTAGVPLIKNGELKVTIKQGNDTRVFETSRLRDGLDGKLAQFFPSSPPKEENASGDALPEAQVNSDESIVAASLDTEFTSEVLGRGALSGIFTSISDRTTILGGGLFYNWRSREEKLTLLATIHNSNMGAANVSRDYKSKASLRSSQFPIINSDLSIHGQEFNTTTLATKMITLRPLNLVGGDIRLKIIDKAGNEGTFRELLRSNWRDAHIDRTYKLYLPKHLRYQAFRGKILVKRSNGLFEEVGIEALIGFDHAVEFRYEHTPEQENTYKLLTSVLTGSGTYGLHHRIDPMLESSENDDDNSLISLEADELALEKYRYRGTYIFGELSMKASGVFVARKGREILPFSKFGIRLTTADENGEGHRIIGAETVNENIHNMQIAIKKGTTNLFEFKNEMNPTSQVPFKATISFKDYAEVKIHDNSKFTNTRDLQVKAKWIPGKRIAIGKIVFPTSLEEPLYLDVDVSMASESDRENPLFKMTSSSSIEFGSNSSLTTENAFQTPNSKWEFGLDGFLVNSQDDSYNDSEESFVSKNLLNMSFSAHYLHPNLDKYACKIAGHHYSMNSDSSDKLYLSIERPHVTPLQLHLEAVEDSRYDSSQDTENTDFESLKFIVKFCHKDNFLYLFPTLNADFTVETYGETLSEMRYESSPQSALLFRRGKLVCKSKGIYLPLCNQVNLSYKLNSEDGYNDNKPGPWVANLSAINEQLDLTDEVTLKLYATYDPVRPASENNYRRRGIVEEILSTVQNEKVFKNNYNFEYDLERKDASKQVMLGVNGTYIFTKIYESLNFFEFSDQLRWSQMDGGRFHIWTNLLNHTTDSNLTSESATFSSQYVSLGDVDGGADGESSNITWMELKSLLSSNGLGTIQTILLNPSKVLAFNEGDIEADLLIKTEFSPLKTFRLLFSHEQSKSENEDDESTKYGASTKLNGILNEVELSGTNLMTLAMGKFIGIGESLEGRFSYNAREEIYEYVTIKAFGIAPSQLSETDNNLVHFDVSSSWTNVDDNDTELRIVKDVIFKAPLRQVPLFRLAYFENSTDLNFERNGSLLIYRSSPDLERTEELRFPDSIVSEGLDELSFTQTSLQSISQQIIDDYIIATKTSEDGSSSVGDDGEEDGYDYNFEIKSKSVLHNDTFMNYDMKVKWLAKLFYCQSSFETCSETRELRVDTSNYCNLMFLSLKYVL